MQTKFLHKMKRVLCTTLLFLLLCAVGMAKAYAQTIGDLIYSLDNDNLTATVTGHVDGTAATGTLTIPESVNYEGTLYSVTTIGDSAFYNCSGFTGGLTIPNSVTSIGEFAFCYCSGFSGSLVMPNSVTSIGGRAFTGCTGFTGNLILPNSITAINRSVFYGCSGFTGNLSIPNTVTSIDYGAFYDCSGFTGSLTIPNSVTSIGDYAFRCCSGFTGSLMLPDSVVTIGNYAFYNCNGFTGDLTIPSSVTSIGTGAFNSCSGFTVVNFNATNCADVSNSSYPPFQGCEGTLVIGSNVERIPAYMFYGCSGFTGSLTIPHSVTSIGNYAFSGCSGFTGVYYTGSISQWCDVLFGDGASNPLYYAHNLYIDNELVTDLVIPENVTEINARSFYGATCITSLTIGEQVTSIGNYAFENCNNINNVYYTGSISQWCNISFVSGTSNPLYYARNYYFENELVTSLVIPEDVTEIKAYAFYHAIHFTLLNLGNSVTSIGNSAFAYCSGFSGSLTIGNSVTTIGNNAFQYCSGFTGNLTIGNSVTSIGNSAFNYCRSFTGSLIIPNSVTSIGAYAFYYCSGFTGNLAIGNSVTSIGNYAFANCYGFTGNLTIPNSVTTISDYAFGSCYGFTGSLTIPNSVITIGNNAFQHCSGFTGSLTIPDSVTSIGYYAFANCNGFTGNLVISNALTSIGNNAFYFCSGFTGNLTIGSSVTSIGNNAFYYCRGFTSITSLAELPPTIGSNAFYYVNHDIPVTVPCGSVAAYQNASVWNQFTIIVQVDCPSYEISATIHPEGSGFVTGTGTFEVGEICILTATLGEGYCFDNWTENGDTVSMDVSYSFIVTGDRNLVANFVEGNACVLTFNLYDSYGDGWSGNKLVVTDGNGISRELTFSSGTSTSYNLQFVDGSHVTLGWISGSYTEECSFTISYSNGNVTYQGSNLNNNFSYEFEVDCEEMPAISYAIIAETNPEVGGTVEGAGIYEYGQTCTLTALANEDYNFIYWMENGQQVSSSAMYSFTVTDVRSLVAVFTPKSVGMVTAMYDPDPNNIRSPYVKTCWTTHPNMCEDFERGDFSLFDWQLDSNHPWTITTNNPYEGTCCMKSGGAGVASVVSNMTVTVDIPIDGVMSFWGRISCENAWDNGSFYIDGVQKGSWSGNGDWQQHSYDITAGEHTFQWRYTKDSSVNGNDDCFYVDSICFVNSARGGNRSIHFMVYRDEDPESGAPILIADNVTDTCYVDSTWRALNGGWYRYGIKACYSEIDTTLLNVSDTIWSNRIQRPYAYIITTEANPVEGGLVTGAGSFEEGDTCTLVATAKIGYAFENWTNEGDVVSNSTTYSFPVTEDDTLVANFACLTLGEFSYMTPANNYPFTFLPITFTWNAVSGSKYYNLYLWNVNEPAPDTPVISQIYNRSYWVSSLQNHQTYNWYVEAQNDCYSTTSSVRSFSLNIPPLMNISTDSIDFGDRMLNDNVTYNMYVRGNALDDSITIQITGEDASMFSCEQGSNWNSYTGGLISVTFNPTTIKFSFSADLIITSGSINKTVHLTGGLADMIVFNTYVEQDVFSMNSTVPIHGMVMDVYNNPIASAEVEVKVKVMNMTRSLYAITGADGHFSVDFVPAYSESGYYTVNSGRVGHNSTVVHDDFNIPGMDLVTNDWILWNVVQNETSMGSIVIRNRSQIPLNNIQVIANTSPEGCSFTFQPLSLAGMEEGVLEYSVNGSIPTNGYQEVRLVASSSEGALMNFTVWYRCTEPRGVLHVSPSAISTTMTKGVNKTMDIMLYNNGTDPTGNIYVVTPSVDWMSVVGSNTLPSIAVHDSAYFSLRLSANENTSLVQYTGNIAINSERGDGVSLPYSILAVSDSTGTLIVDVTDDYTYNGNGQHLAGATVTVKGYYSLDTVAMGLTDSNGLFTVSDIPEGWYNISISAPHHAEYHDNILIQGGQTNTQDIYLQYQAITYSWIVVPTEIPDEYSFEFNVEYETNVPVPVIVIEMPQTLPELDEGDSFVFDYIITNHGLVNSYDVKLYVPTGHPDYEFTALITEIDTLRAQSTMIIPCTMTRRVSPRSQSVREALGDRGNNDGDCPDYVETKVRAYYLCRDDLMYHDFYGYMIIGSHPCPYVPNIPSGGGFVDIVHNTSDTPQVTSQGKGCGDDSCPSEALEELNNCPPKNNGTPKLPPILSGNKNK